MYSNKLMKHHLLPQADPHTLDDIWKRREAQSNAVKKKEQRVLRESKGMTSNLFRYALLICVETPQFTCLHKTNTHTYTYTNVWHL